MKAIYLRTAREGKGLTQEQLEALSTVPQPVISRLETEADAKAMFDTVVNLADALDLDPRQLRFGPDPKTRERVAS